MEAQVSNESSHTTVFRKFDRNQSHVYRIAVFGKLSASWSNRLCNLRIYPLPTAPPEVTITVLEGLIADQSQLCGVLSTLLDLRLSLLEVKLVPERETSP